MESVGIHILFNATTQCLLCRCSLPAASLRRRLESKPELVPIVQTLTGVRTGLNSEYACRPCFSKLEKSLRAVETLRSVGEDARRALGLPHAVSIVVRGAGYDHATQTAETEEGQSGSDPSLASRTPSCTKALSTEDRTTDVGKETLNLGMSIAIAELIEVLFAVNAVKVT